MPEQTSETETSLLSQLTIVVATYNERETLPVLVEGLIEQLPGCRILVVDDNSPDGTGDWARQQLDINPRLELLHREDERGLGSATLAGIRQALLANQTQWVGTMDADLSHTPSDMRRLWSALQSADKSTAVAIGSRYASGGKIENWPLSRRLLSRLVNAYCRLCLRIPVSDSTSAMRIYHRDALESIALDQIDTNGYAYLEQMLLHLKRSSQLIEVPIVFTDRSSGASKASWAVSFRAAIDLLRMGFRRR